MLCQLTSWCGPRGEGLTIARPFDVMKMQRPFCSVVLFRIFDLRRFSEIMQSYRLDCAL